MQGVRLLIVDENEQNISLTIPSKEKLSVSVSKPGEFSISVISLLSSMDEIILCK
jgi:hypothetical protein